MRRAISIVVAVVLAGCTTGYQPNQDKSSLARSELAAPERAFLIDMAESMHQRMTLSELAARKSDKPSLRKVADSFAKSSKKLAEEFKNALAANELKLSSAPQPATVQELTHMRTLSGTDFNRQFVSNQTQSLLRDIGRAETEARQGRNPKTRKLAQETLPALHQQLDQLRQVSDSVAFY